MATPELPLDERFAFLVLKPDAVEQRLGPQLLSWLERRGFAARHCQSGEITPEQRAALYRDHLSSGRTNWQLGGGLYELGEAQFILLHGGRRDRPAASFLSSVLKGHFDPERAAANTMRGHFPAFNPVFNLVHSSDTSEDAIREASLFVDPELVSRVARGRADEQAHVARPPTSTGRGTLNLCSAVGQLMHVVPPDDPGLRRGWIAACDALLAVPDTVSPRLQRRCLAKTLGRLRRMSEERAHPLLDDDLTAVDYASLLSAARVGGARLTPFEAYLAHTSLYYLEFA